MQYDCISIERIESMVRLTLAFCAAVMSVLLASTILPAMTAATAATLNDEPAKVQDDLPFKPSNNQMNDVTIALEKAKAEDKLGLVIMGANWCHDSLALVSKLHDPNLADIIEKNYETILVDVGELEHGQDVIERFGMPVIYGTPTVLIVDPSSEKQLNRHDMHQWRNAYSIEQAEITAYFKKMGSAETRDIPAADPENSVLMTLLEEVNAFEKAQSKRIYRAFALVGPMLNMKQPERPENFGELWNELRDFRYQITDDLASLREEARNRVAAGETTIALAYPSYEPFSWEK